MAVHWSPDYSPPQASYDLRRLRLKGFIERVEHTNTYRVTPLGRRMTTFLTKLATRVVIPALTELDTLLRPPKTTSHQLRDAWRAYEPPWTPWSEGASPPDPARKLASNAQDGRH